MAFEPIHNEISACKCKKLAAQQTVVDATLNPPAEFTIEKVLSVGCHGCVSAAEVFAGEARYNGKVEFSVLYADGDGAVRCMECVCEFSDRIEGPSLGGKTKPVFTCDIVDFEVVGATQSEVKISCVAEITLCENVAEKMNYVCELGENVYTKENKMTYCKSVAGGTKNFTVTGGGDTGFDRVVSSSACAVLRAVSTENDSVVFEGDVIVHVIGMGEDGMPAEKDFVLPFAEQAAAEDARSGDYASVRVCVTDSNVRVALSEDGFVAEIRVEAKAEFDVFSQYSAEVISDAFSLSRELILEREEREITCEWEKVSFNEEVSGNVTLASDMPPADRILCRDGFGVRVTEVSLKGGRVTVEGILSGYVLYCSDDVAMPCSVHVEVPFSVTEKAFGEGKYQCEKAEAFVLSVVVKSRRASEIAVKADIMFCVEAARTERVAMIANVAEGAEKQNPDAALIIHMAATGEDLWEVSKLTGATPEEIIAQNPDIDLPMSQPARLVIYKNIAKED